MRNTFFIQILNEFIKFSEGILDFSKPYIIEDLFIEEIEFLKIDDLRTSLGDIGSGFNELKEIYEKTIVKEKLNVVTAKAILDNLKVLVERIISIKINLITFSQSSNDKKEEIIFTVKKKIIDFLITSYLEKYHKGLFSVFIFLGVVDDSNLVNFKNLFRLFSKPEDLFNEIYNWENYLHHKKLLNRILLVLNNFGIFAEKHPFNDKFNSLFAKQNPTGEEIRIPLLFGGYQPESYYEVGISLAIAPSKDFGNIGLSLFPYLIGTTIAEIDLGDNFELIIDGELDIGRSLGFIFKPGEKIEILSSIINGSFDTETDFNFRAQIKGKESKKGEIENLTPLIGGASGTGLFFERGNFIFFANNIDGEQDLGLEVGIEGLTFVIDIPKENTLLQKLVNKSDINNRFDLFFQLSKSEGFSIRGNAGFEAVIPIHKPIGPLTIQSIYIGIVAELSGETEKLALIIGANVKIDIKIIQFQFLEIGIESSLSEKKQNNNFESLSLSSPNFKNPSLVGITITSKILIGSGSLEISENRYTGSLSLQIEKIELNAFGVITTKLPNGKDGFSMLVNLNVTFGSPIQLGAGFVLEGVGGLVGVNRTIDVETLRERAHSGTVNNLMFPELPLEDVNSLISDLESVFPTKENSTVIAPLFKLGWGALPIEEDIAVDVDSEEAPIPESLVKIQLGVFLEFPFKNRVILLGKVHTILPDKEQKLITLNLNVFGDLNFARKYVLLEGTLYDSYVKELDVKGDFVFKYQWGRKKQFLFSIGGFHPSYTPPANFRRPERLQAIFYKEDGDVILSLVCKLYLAITSNTLQTGFSADLDLRYKKVQALGEFKFNTLIQFKPFKFIGDASFRVEVIWRGRHLLGIGLYLSLSGPKPWHAIGSAEISVWAFSISVGFDITWGDKTAILPKAIDPTKDLVAQLKANQNWGGELPSHVFAVEAIGTNESSEEILVHPASGLSLRQMLLPLNFEVEKLGTSPLNTPTTYSLVELVGDKEVSLKATKEYFAIGQYQYHKTAEEILSAEDFEEMDAGVYLNDDDKDVGGGSTIIAGQYENIIIKEDLTANRRIDGARWALNNSFNFRRNATVRQWRRLNKDIYGPKQHGFTFNESEEFFIVSKTDLAVSGTSFSTKAQALSKLRKLKGDKLQIITSLEKK